MKLLRACLLLVASALGLPGADVTEVTVNPWHGDNAVVAMGRVPFGSSRRSEWLSGTATRPAGKRRDLSVSFSTAPNQWKRLDVGRSAGTAEVPWSYDSVPESNQPGVPFDLTLAERNAQGTYVPLRTLTNVVAGPVWVVLVTPGSDGHHLPPIPAEVLQRIRILPLDGWTDHWTSPGWLTGEALKRHPYFCGLPRGLAILLARNTPASGSPPPIFGLVLTPAMSAANAAISDHPLAGWKPESRDDLHPYLSTVVTNAFHTTYFVPFGAEARHNALIEEHRAASLDAKREGIVLPKFATPLLLWSRFAVGDLPEIPFRIHGVLH